MGSAQPVKRSPSTPRDASRAGRATPPSPEPPNAATRTDLPASAALRRATRKRWSRRLANSVRAFLVLFCLVVGGLTLLPAALGYQHYTVTTNAMNGTIDTGAIVYDKPVPVSALKVHDVITFVAPAGTPYAGRHLTERIVTTSTGLDGQPRFQTKGDHDAAPEPWQFSLNGSTQAVVAFHVPLAGYLLAALGTPIVRLIIVVGLALAIVVRLLYALGQEARDRASTQQRATFTAIMAARAAVAGAIATRDAAQLPTADDAAPATPATPATPMTPAAPAPTAAGASETTGATGHEAPLDDAARAAALAALIAASSASAASRDLAQMHGDDADGSQAATA